MSSVLLAGFGLLLFQRRRDDAGLSPTALHVRPLHLCEAIFLGVEEFA